MNQRGTPYQKFQYMKSGYNDCEMKNIQHIILGVLITSVIVLTSYVWFATAGTWKIWPSSTNYYNLLANAFIQGQVSLDLEVPQELLALPNPYKVSERKNVDYLWDASLYKGRYYLYWGPLPAIVIAAIVFGSWYTIDQRERGVILRNGRLIGTATPGLGFKLPLVDNVVKVSLETMPMLLSSSRSLRTWKSISA